MRGCAGVFTDSESRLTACGVLEPVPSNLTFLLAMGELDALSSTLRLLGMFSLVGEAMLLSFGSAFTLGCSVVPASGADSTSHSVEISLWESFTKLHVNDMSLTTQPLLMFPDSMS